MGQVAAVKPHEQRVVDEALDLGRRLQSLRSFVRGDTFNTLHGADAALLLLQERQMSELLDTLRERIKRFDFVRTA